MSSETAVSKTASKTYEEGLREGLKSGFSGGYRAGLFMAVEHYRCMHCGKCVCTHSEDAKANVQDNQSIADWQKHIRTLVRPLVPLVKVTSE